MQRLFPYLAAMVLIGTSAVAAVAHAFLNQAVPPVGGTVAASPPEIRLYFSEAIEPRFSEIELTSLDGRPVKTGPSTVDPRDQMQFVLPVEPALPSGRYKVTWHVVSVDTHPTQGDFTFEIKP
jgi:methionine-rich copper-binding protein CopC